MCPEGYLQKTTFGALCLQILLQAAILTYTSSGVVSYLLSLTAEPTEVGALNVTQFVRDAAEVRGIVYPFFGALAFGASSMFLGFMYSLVTNRYLRVDEESRTLESRKEDFLHAGRVAPNKGQ